MKTTQELVDRFLAWPLPESVCSDLCATTRGYPQRTGTNLLTADEARQMIEYLLADYASDESHDDLFAIHAMTECVAEVSPEPLPGEHLTVRNVRNLCALINSAAP